MAMTISVHGSPGSSVRNADRVFEDAQASGELRLNCRKLKEYPSVSQKYDLSDLVYADLSKNRFSELPEQICTYILLEQLDCYNNVIRFIPDNIANLQALTFLDLSRNQLTYIPVALCHLPLQICILRNNRLVSIPEEINCMKCIRDLDVSCNEITIIPPQIGNVLTLQTLNLRRNLLLELPLELCQLKLMSLDVSGNRISSLPTQLRLMISLQDLVLDHNPMTFPPAVLCRRGRIHVFKFLEIQAIKEDKQGIVLENEFKKFRSPSTLSDARFQNGFAAGSCRKSYTFDSGYSTSDCDSRSQESQEFVCGSKRYPLDSPIKWEASNHSLRNQNPCFVSGNVEDKVTEEVPSNIPCDPKPQIQIQTYKAYKQQKAAENMYKKSFSSDDALLTEFGTKLPMTRAETSVSVKYTAGSGSLPTSVEVELKEKHHTLVTPLQFTPTSMEPTIPENKPKEDNNGSSCVLKIAPKLSTSADENSNGRLNFTWPKNNLASKPAKSSFTMKREFDKAREEQELLMNLRETLESRLKLKLPEEMEPALYDGVFLCHLANQVHPNSVACIHVPSPTVPKLTVAKCRRNVDNFLEACRRLGVPNAGQQRWEDSKQTLAQMAPAFQSASCSKEIFSPGGASVGEILLSCFLVSVFFATLLLLYYYPSPEITHFL